jgi:DNA (cytosine-5)-methyltransferase 1
MHKCIELFAGSGGLALGLEQAGFKTIALNEIDKNACSTLKHNRPNWNVIQQDIIEICNNNITEVFNIGANELDLLSGGFPCQAFSYAGQRKGLADIRGTMFEYYTIVLKELKPKMFLAENVKGLLTHDNGNTFKTIISTFENAGYKVKYQVLNAWDYDNAQKRERVVVVGVRSDLVEHLNYNFPTKHTYKPVLRDVLQTVPESLGEKYSESKKAVMDLVPPGGCWINLPDDIARQYMKTCYSMEGGKRGIARRLSMNEPSLTLTCSPSMKQTERCHPYETRPLTVREYARIQSFPDSWEFMGKMNSQYKQIGNAVPVNLAKAIGQSIIECLKGRENAVIEE